MKFNYRQLTFAREFRGYSQSELAASINGLSQPNLSKYEKGFNTLSDEMVLKTIEFLKFPKEWLYQEVKNTSENANYRKRTTLSKKDKLKIEYKNRLIGYVVDQLSDSIDWPDFKFTPLNIEDGYSVVDIAHHTRKFLGLHQGEPIVDICTLLENNGIIIVEVKENEKFDGVSFLTDYGIPVIITNKNFSNDRKRRTLVHELGHILMHSYFTVPDYRNKEFEADGFTNEFLMPENYIKNSLFKLRLNDLTELKRYWLTSMQSIVRRAKDLNCISKEKYTYFNIELSRNGKKKDEGVPVYIDEPALFKEAYNIHINEIGYSNSDLSFAFKLPVDIINDFFTPSNLRVI